MKLLFPEQRHGNMKTAIILVILSIIMVACEQGTVK